MVTPTVTLQTTRSVTKTVADATVLGYEAAYACYFNTVVQEPPTRRADPDPAPSDDHCD